MCDYVGLSGCVGIVWVRVCDYVGEVWVRVCDSGSSECVWVCKCVFLVDSSPPPCVL